MKKLFIALLLKRFSVFMVLSNHYYYYHQQQVVIIVAVVFAAAVAVVIESGLLSPCNYRLFLLLPFC